MVSQLIPGTWMLPGVLQVACKAFRAFLLGDFDIKVLVVPGTFSLPLALEMLGAEPPLDTCRFPVK